MSGCMVAKVMFFSENQKPKTQYLTRFALRNQSNMKIRTVTYTNTRLNASSYGMGLSVAELFFHPFS